MPVISSTAFVLHCFPLCNISNGFLCAQTMQSMLRRNRRRWESDSAHEADSDQLQTDGDTFAPKRARDIASKKLCVIACWCFLKMYLHARPYAISFGCILHVASCSSVAYPSSQSTSLTLSLTTRPRATRFGASKNACLRSTVTCTRVVSVFTFATLLNHLLTKIRLVVSASHKTVLPGSFCSCEMYRLWKKQHLAKRCRCIVLQTVFLNLTVITLWSAFMTIPLSAPFI
jgi:hypothetical protein